jgi:hypothetical protein
MATDSCGNSSSCSQTIFIDDSVPPMITCPADITLQCTDGLGLEETGMATATDNCDPAPILTFTDLVAFEFCP